MDAALIALSITCGVGVSYLQARALVGSGSDHPVHVFLSNALRLHHRRLFARVPGLLNPSYCSAYPLYLHWILSFLPPQRLRTVARLLNPIVNGVWVTLCVAVVKLSRQVPSQLSDHAGLTALVFSLTPQFFHASSARSYGITSRPVGLLLMQGVLFVGFASPARWSLLFIVVGIALAYLIWGFNTFAQQAMLLFGLALGAVAGSWTVLAFAFVSLGIFVLFNGVYARSYLVHTAQFVAAYATRLARVFVLKQRYSIWRDLVWDIWIRFHRSMRKGLRYAYDNPVLIVLLLNPLFPLALWAKLNRSLPPGFVDSCGTIAVVGLLAFLCTSLRVTRFLGEPERYVEFASMFASIAGLWYLWAQAGRVGVILVLIYFAVACVAQWWIVRVLRAQMAEQIGDVSVVENAITHRWGTEPVRFAANNEIITKLLMGNPWSFVRFWSAEQCIAGYSVDQAFTAFPHVDRAPFEALVKEYQVNAFVLDKSNFGQVFEQDADARERLEPVLETKQLMLYRLRW